MKHSPPKVVVTPMTVATAITGHIDDAASMDIVCAALAAIHGAAYGFRIARWQGQHLLSGQPGRHHFYFVMQSDDARVSLVPGQRVRGVPPASPYQPLGEGWGNEWGEVSAPSEEELWPGDVLCVEAEQTVTVTGSAVCFCVESEASAYPLPTVAFLRHLDDRPGGCAAYPGAFRREALPPVRSSLLAKGGQEGEVDADRRGPNRVNEHTLDMRIDRDPRPRPHHHGPVTTGPGTTGTVNKVNHSETALVLPRSRYALPPFRLQEGSPQASAGERDHGESGQIVIYHQPATDPSDTITVPVRPGSVVVTPATVDHVAGHCFENAFAMLVAIPGFVSPHHNITP